MAAVQLLTLIFRWQYPSPETYLDFQGLTVEHDTRYYPAHCQYPANVICGVQNWESPYPHTITSLQSQNGTGIPMDYDQSQHSADNRDDHTISLSRHTQYGKLFMDNFNFFISHVYHIFFFFFHAAIHVAFISKHCHFSSILHAILWLLCRLQCGYNPPRPV